jgi:4a-hydroxytetrahydrobiopterin dehydratase
MRLSEKKCIDCSGETPKLSPPEAAQLLLELKDWQINAQNRLQKSVKLKDFKQSLSLANRIGDIAEEEGHHPDLTVRWAELVITIWTHAVDGLTENDFILAAKIDEAVAA